MRQRARKTVATNMAMALAPSHAARRPHAAVAPAATAPEMLGKRRRHTSGRATTRAAPCGGQRTTAAPGRRGERPPQSGPALTGALARRPVSVGPGGRSPLRPGWCRRSSTTQDRNGTGGHVRDLCHHAIDCGLSIESGASLRSRRSAAAALTNPAGSPCVGSYVMAQATESFPQGGFSELNERPRASHGQRLRRWLKRERLALPNRERTTA